jgi:hypothetical protein
MAPQIIGIAQNGLGDGAGSQSVQKENEANPVFQRGGDEVSKMEDKLGRLDAAREALAFRRRKAARWGCARTQRNETGAKPLITKETAKWLIQRRQ